MTIGIARDRPHEAGRSQARPRFGTAHALSVVGALFLVWQVWGVGSWLLGGPHEVTRYRDPSSASWWAARAYEALAVGMALAVGTRVVRGCRRERRLTLDAKLCIAGFAAFWLDSGVNWIQPLFFYSSNWVNLGEWSGHVPFVVNPDAGRLPEPVLFVGLVYTFGLLLFAMVINAVMRSVRARRPSISNLRLVLVAWAVGIAVDLAFEVPMYRLHLFAYPGSPAAPSLMHGAERLPLVEVLMASLIFMGIALVRFFRDDAGHSVVERGLEHRSPRWRAATSTVAMVGVTNLLLFGGVSAQMAMGLFAAPYPNLPAHLVNGMCDVPGGPWTRYGACPNSSPAYRIPLRGALPGSKP